MKFTKKTPRACFYPYTTKRILDLFLSIAVLILMSPFFVFILVLHRAIMGAPSFFVQKRVGVKNRLFKIYKLRTSANAKPPIKIVENLQEKWSLFLRISSIDEIPQLINIIKGQMSLVGPRPLLPRDLIRLNYNKRYRHKVLPGLTGLAQVNGRNSITWEEKFSLDKKYIRECSFCLDLKILLKTIYIVLKKEGVFPSSANGTFKNVGISSATEQSLTEREYL